MMTAMLTARNILAGERIYDIWQVNEDAEYHEAGASSTQAALASERLVPSGRRPARRKAPRLIRSRDRSREPGPGAMQGDH
jgi:hypothetical protein